MLIFSIPKLGLLGYNGYSMISTGICTYIYTYYNGIKWGTVMRINHRTLVFWDIVGETMMTTDSGIQTYHPSWCVISVWQYGIPQVSGI